MDVRALRYSLAIARFGSFTKAAESLHVAQPALSVSIRKLESELGVTLFVRKAHRVEPTVEGRILLSRAERIFTEMDSAINEICGMACVTVRTSSASESVRVLPVNPNHALQKSFGGPRPVDRP